MMLAAAVISTLMIVVMMMVAVVAALYIRIEVQAACDKCFHCLVSIAADTSEELDTSIGKCHLCTTADTSAD